MTDKRVLPMVIMSRKNRYNTYQSPPPPWQLRYYQSESNLDCRSSSRARSQSLQPHPNSLRTLQLPYPDNSRTIQVRQPHPNGTPQLPEPHSKNLKDLEKRVNTLEKSREEKTNACSILTKKVEELEKRLLNLEQKIQEKDNAADIIGECSSTARSAELLQRATTLAMTKSKTENQQQIERALQDMMIELKLKEAQAAIRDAPKLRRTPISTELLILPDIRHYARVEEAIPENSGTNNSEAKNTPELHTASHKACRRGEGSRNFYKTYQGKKEEKSNVQPTNKQRNSDGVKKPVPEEARLLDDSSQKSTKPSASGNKAEKVNDQKCDDESNVSIIKYPSEAEALKQGFELEKPFPSPLTVIGEDEMNETVSKSVMNVTCLAELYQYERKFKKITVLSL